MMLGDSWNPFRCGPLRIDIGEKTALILVSPKFIVKQLKGGAICNAVIDVNAGHLFSGSIYFSILDAGERRLPFVELIPAFTNVAFTILANFASAFTPFNASEDSFT